MNIFTVGFVPILSFKILKPFMRCTYPAKQM